jgi:hypothetical protein
MKVMLWCLRQGDGDHVGFQVDGPGFREVLMQGNGQRARSAREIGKLPGGETTAVLMMWFTRGTGYGGRFGAANLKAWLACCGVGLDVRIGLAEEVLVDLGLDLSPCCPEGGTADVPLGAGVPDRLDQVQRAQCPQVGQ